MDLVKVSRILQRLILALPFFALYRRRTDFRLTVKNEVVGVNLSHGDGLKRWLKTYR